MDIPDSFDVRGKRQHLDTQRLQQILEDFIRVKDWLDALPFVEQNPELLTGEADTLLGKRIASEDIPKVKHLLEEHRSFLRRYQQIGGLAAVAEKYVTNLGSTAIEFVESHPVLSRFNIQTLAELKRVLAVHPEIDPPFANIVTSSASIIPEALLDPGGILVQRGFALLEVGKPQEALACFDHALAMFPQDIQSLHGKGVAFISLGEPQTALDFLDQALALHPKYKHAWFDKGRALKRLGEIEAAIEAYDRVLELDPEEADAWSDKGNDLSALGRYRESLVCCERAIELAPKFAFAWCNKGVALSGLGRKDEALACYEHAVELDPEYAQAWSNKGSIYSQKGQFAKALPCFEQALQFEPQNAHAWANKGATLAYLGRLHESLSCFDHALELGYPDALQNILLVREQAGMEPDPRFVLVASFMGVLSWQESQQFIEQHPELSSEAFAPFWQQLILLSRQADQDELADNYARHYQVLSRCSEIGIDAALAEAARQGPKNLAAVLEKFMNSDLDEAQKLIKRHPELLTDEAISMLDLMASEMYVRTPSREIRPADHRVRQRVAERRQLLLDFREYKMQVALARGRQSEELREIINNFVITASLSERIELIRKHPEILTGEANAMMKQMAREAPNWDAKIIITVRRLIDLSICCDNLEISSGEQMLLDLKRLSLEAGILEAIEEGESPSSIAAFLVQLGHLAAAVEILDLALEENPQDVRAWNDKGGDGSLNCDTCRRYLWLR